jgi:Tfp pilus assembly protein PilN
LNEFFQEKLKIPVEYFNALRNVELGRKVDQAALTSQAHALGELIGLGLRGTGACPVEIDLVPRVVARERMVEKRAGLFWMAGISVAILLAALGFYYQKAGQYAQENGGSVAKEVNTLKKFEAEIAEQQGRLEMIRGRSKPYSEAVLGRIYWITTFRELSEAIVDDKIWIVELQPLSGTSPLIAEPRRAGEANLLAGGDPMLATLPAGPHTIDGLQIKGLWRENTQGGSKVVYSYLDRLRQSKRPFFDLVERDPATGDPVMGAEGVAKKFTDGELLNPINHGTGNDRHAYDFTLRLPLPEGRRIQFTK